MPSTAALVEDYLEGDLVIERALARGVLSLRRGARWLIRQQGWDASEEAVVSALRRYSPRPVHESIENGYELLRDARTGLQTGLGLVIVSKAGSALDQVLEALERTGTGGPAGLLPGSETTSLIVTSDEALDIEARGGDHVDEVVRPMSQISVELPRENPASGTALSILLQTFSYRGIPLLGVSSSAGTYCFLVNGKITNRAHDVLLHLRGEVLVHR